MSRPAVWDRLARGPPGGGSHRQQLPGLLGSGDGGPTTWACLFGHTADVAVVTITASLSPSSLHQTRDNELLFAPGASCAASLRAYGEQGGSQLASRPPKSGGCLRETLENKTKGRREPAPNSEGPPFPRPEQLPQVGLLQTCASAWRRLTEVPPDSRGYFESLTRNTSMMQSRVQGWGGPGHIATDGRRCMAARPSNQGVIDYILITCPVCQDCWLECPKCGCFRQLESLSARQVRRSEAKSWGRRFGFLRVLCEKGLSQVSA